MALGRDFPVLFPLYDITIYDLAAASTKVQTPVSGSLGASGDNTYIKVTDNTIPNGSSQLPSDMAAEVLAVECISPVVTNGGSTLYPDFQWAPYPDAVDLSSPTPANKFLADGSFGGNLFPLSTNIVDRRNVTPLVVGVSLRKLLNDAKNGRAIGDMALKATGWKYNSTFQSLVQSKRGWGTSVSGDTVVTPGRLIFWGERYTDQMLAPFAGMWNGSFTRTTLRRYLERIQVPETVAGVQNGTVSVADLPTLSGGYRQRGAVVFRDVRFAQNLAATATSANYYLTNSQQAYGSSGKVDTQYSSDLGLPFAPVNGNAANARSAILLQKAGVVPGVTNLAYFGLQVGGGIVPDPNGWPVGENVDRYAYGNVQPLRSESEIYYSLPDLENEIDIFAENAAWFVAANGTAIGVKDAAVATAGVAIELAGSVTASSGPAA